MLAAQELPELEVKYPAVASLERWGHLPRREFSDYTGLTQLLPSAGSFTGRHLLKGSLDGRTVVLKGHTLIAGLQQLEREIEALKVLQHPNIVAAFGACRHQTPSGMANCVRAFVLRVLVN